MTTQVKTLFALMLIVSFSLRNTTAQTSTNLSSIDLSDGECYAKFIKPATYEDVTRKVKVKDASQRTKHIPAQYETVNEQAVVTPEHVVKIPVPAVFETVEEKVMIKPERRRLKKVPAEYETVTEEVLVKEASVRFVPVPAVYETVEEKILVTPEDRKLGIVPATYQNITEQIVAKAASQRMIVIPPEFEEVSERYEITPASTKTVQLEPKYKTVSEVIEVQPASTKWMFQQGDKNCLSANPADCLVWCLEEVPAKYKTVTKRINIGCDGSGIENSGCTQTVEIPAEYGTRTKRILKTPAQSKSEEIPAAYQQLVKTVIATPTKTTEEIIPAVYKTIQKQIVKIPATFKEEIIPAIYETITKRVIKKPESVVEEIIPAEYAMVVKQVLKSPATTRDEFVPAIYQTIDRKMLVAQARENVIAIPEQYENVTEKKLVQEAEIVYRRIICDKHLVGAVAKKIQQGLKDAGFDPGPIDNIIGKKTKAAIRNFQLSKGLYTGPIDFATAFELGIDVPNYAPARNDEAAFFAGNAGNSGASANRAETKVIAATGIAFNEKGAARKNGEGNVMEGQTGGEAAGKNSNLEDKAKAAAGTNEHAAENSKETPPAENKNSGDTGGTTMSSKEVSMLDEINLMRSNPAGYIPFVEAYLKKIENDNFWGEDFKKEEKAAGMELIAELRKLGPLSQLKAHQGLYDVSVKHGKDMKSMGKMRHVGSDGSHPYKRVQQNTELSGGTENLVGGGADVRESVIMLLVDAGIPNRGHRKALLDPKWRYGACHEVGMVGEQNDSWVQMFGVE